MRIAAALVVLVLVALFGADSAYAHSGEIKDIHRVSATRWKATLSTTRDSCPPERYCGGWSTAAHMPVGTDCPSEPYDGADTTQVFWSTDLEDPYAGSTATVGFTPEEDATDTQLCLYVYANGYHLVSQTAFNHAATTPPPPSDIGLPDFDATSRTERARGRQRFSVTADGCLSFDRDADEQLWEYTRDMSCTTARLELRKNGRHYDTSLIKRSSTLSWTCRRSGKYAWKIVFTNRSVPGRSSGDPYTTTARGTFSVPDCRPRKPRRVGRGLASKWAYDLNQSAYESEFISAVRCSPSGGRSPSSVWVCRTTHNNTYRECVDTDRIVFTSHDKFGRVDQRTRLKTLKKRCRYF